MTDLFQEGLAKLSGSQTGKGFAPAKFPGGNATLSPGPAAPPSAAPPAAAPVPIPRPPPAGGQDRSRILLYPERGGESKYTPRVGLWEAAKGGNPLLFGLEAIRLFGSGPKSVIKEVEDTGRWLEAHGLSLGGAGKRLEAGELDTYDASPSIRDLFTQAFDPGREVQLQHVVRRFGQDREGLIREYEKPSTVMLEGKFPGALWADRGITLALETIVDPLSWVGAPGAKALSAGGSRSLARTAWTDTIAGTGVTKSALRIGAWRGDAGATKLLAQVDEFTKAGRIDAVQAFDDEAGELARTAAEYATRQGWDRTADEALHTLMRRGGGISAVRDDAVVNAIADSGISGLRLRNNIFSVQGGPQILSQAAWSKVTSPWRKVRGGIAGTAPGRFTSNLFGSSQNRANLQAILEVPGRQPKIAGNIARSQSTDAAAQSQLDRASRPLEEMLNTLGTAVSRNRDLAEPLRRLMSKGQRGAAAQGAEALAGLKYGEGASSTLDSFFEQTAAFARAHDVDAEPWFDVVDLRNSLDFENPPTEMVVPASMLGERLRSVREAVESGFGEVVGEHGHVRISTDLAGDPAFGRFDWTEWSAEVDGILGKEFGENWQKTLSDDPVQMLSAHTRTIRKAASRNTSIKSYIENGMGLWKRNYDDARKIVETAGAIAPGMRGIDAEVSRRIGVFQQAADEAARTLADAGEQIADATTRLEALGIDVSAEPELLATATASAAQARNEALRNLNESAAALATSEDPRMQEAAQAILDLVSVDDSAQVAAALPDVAELARANRLVSQQRRRRDAVMKQVASAEAGGETLPGGQEGLLDALLGIDDELAKATTQRDVLKRLAGLDAEGWEAEQVAFSLAAQRNTAGDFDKAATRTLDLLEDAAGQRVPTAGAADDQLALLVSKQAAREAGAQRGLAQATADYEAGLGVLRRSTDEALAAAEVRRTSALAHTEGLIDAARRELVKAEARAAGAVAAVGDSASAARAEAFLDSSAGLRADLMDTYQRRHGEAVSRYNRAAQDFDWDRLAAESEALGVNLSETVPAMRSAQYRIRRVRDIEADIEELAVRTPRTDAAALRALTAEDAAGEIAAAARQGIRVTRTVDGEQITELARADHLYDAVDTARDQLDTALEAGDEFQVNRLSRVLDRVESRLTRWLSANSDEFKRAQSEATSRLEIANRIQDAAPEAAGNADAVADLRLRMEELLDGKSLEHWERLSDYGNANRALLDTQRDFMIDRDEMQAVWEIYQASAFEDIEPLQIAARKLVLSSQRAGYRMRDWDRGLYDLVKSIQPDDWYRSALREGGINPASKTFDPFKVLPTSARHELTEARRAFAEIAGDLPADPRAGGGVNPVSRQFDFSTEDRIKLWARGYRTPKAQTSEAVIEGASAPTVAEAARRLARGATEVPRYPGERPPLPGHVRVYRGAKTEDKTLPAKAQDFYAGPGGDALGYARPGGRVHYFDVPAEDITTAKETIWLPHATAGHDPGTAERNLARLQRENKGQLPDFAMYSEMSEVVPITPEAAGRMVHRGSISASDASAATPMLAERKALRANPDPNKVRYEPIPAPGQRRPPVRNVTSRTPPLEAEPPPYGLQATLRELAGAEGVDEADLSLILQHTDDATSANETAAMFSDEWTEHNTLVGNAESIETAETAAATPALRAIGPSREYPPSQVRQMGMDDALARIELDPGIGQWRHFIDQDTGELLGDARVDFQPWTPASAGRIDVFEYADGRMVVFDGHQRFNGLRRIAKEADDLRAAGKVDAADALLLDAEGAPITASFGVFRESDGHSIDGLFAMVTGRNMRISPNNHPFDVAAAIRQNPELLEDVGWGASAGRAASRVGRSLAELDPEAWRLLRDITFNKGLYPRDIERQVWMFETLARQSREGAWRVTDQGVTVAGIEMEEGWQAAVMHALYEANPQSREEAEAIVHQLASAGLRKIDTPDQAQMGLFGDATGAALPHKEMGQLSAKAQRLLEEDRAASNSAVRRKAILESDSGRTRIDIDEQSSKAQRAATLLDEFRRLKEINNVGFTYLANRVAAGSMTVHQAAATLKARLLHTAESASGFDTRPEDWVLPRAMMMAQRKPPKVTADDAARALNDPAVMLPEASAVTGPTGFLEPTEAEPLIRKLIRQQIESGEAPDYNAWKNSARSSPALRQRLYQATGKRSRNNEFQDYWDGLARETTGEDAAAQARRLSAENTELERTAAEAQEAGVPPETVEAMAAQIEGNAAQINRLVGGQPSELRPKPVRSVKDKPKKPRDVADRNLLRNANQRYPMLNLDGFLRADRRGRWTPTPEGVARANQIASDPDNVDGPVTAAQADAIRRLLDKLAAGSTEKMVATEAAQKTAQAVDEMTAGAARKLVKVIARKSRTPDRADAARRFADNPTDPDTRSWAYQYLFGSDTAQEIPENWKPTKNQRAVWRLLQDDAGPAQRPRTQPQAAQEPRLTTEAPVDTPGGWEAASAAGSVNTTTKRIGDTTAQIMWDTAEDAPVYQVMLTTDAGDAMSLGSFESLEQAADGADTLLARTGLGEDVSPPVGPADKVAEAPPPDAPAPPDDLVGPPPPNPETALPAGEQRLLWPPPPPPEFRRSLMRSEGLIPDLLAHEQRFDDALEAVRSHEKLGVELNAAKERLPEATQSVDRAIRASSIERAGHDELVSELGVFAEQMSNQDALIARNDATNGPTLERLRKMLDSLPETANAQRDQVQAMIGLRSEYDKLAKWTEQTRPQVAADLADQFDAMTSIMRNSLVAQSDAIAITKWDGFLRADQEQMADTAERVLQDYSEKLGGLAENAKVLKLLEDNANMTLRSYHQAMLPEQIAEGLQGTQKFRDLGQFTKRLEQFTAGWRAVAVMRPGFHPRNYIAGTYNNMAFGKVPLRYQNSYSVEYARWASEQGAGRARTAVRHVVGTKVNRDMRADIELSEQLGFIQRGLFTSDLPDVGRAGRTWNPISMYWDRHRIFKPAAWSKEFGGAVEDVLRGSLGTWTYRQGRDTGLSHQAALNDATERIAKLHFDYTNLSDFDRTMRRVVPFWTFLSRNAMLQLEIAAARPARFVAMERLFESIGSGHPFNPYTPEYFEKNRYQQLSANWYMTLEVGQTAALRDWNLNFASSQEPAIAGALNPALRNVVEFTSKKDWFRGYELNQTDLWWRMAENTFPALGNFERLSGQAPIGDTTANERLTSSWLSFMGVPLRKATESDYLRELRFGDVWKEQLPPTQTEAQKDRMQARREIADRQKLARQVALQELRLGAKQNLHAFGQQHGMQSPQAQHCSHG